jgi:hypothetical protein
MAAFTYAGINNKSSRKRKMKRDLARQSKDRARQTAVDSSTNRER